MDGRESDLILKAFDFVVDHEYDRGSVTSFRKNFLPTLHTSPLRYRLEAFRLGSFHMNTEAGLETFLSEDGRVPPGDVNQSTREKLSLVHSVALALGIRYADKIVFPHNNFPVCSVYHEFWSDLVQDIASAAGQEDLHCIETVVPWDVYHVPAWTGTPLISAIGGALCYMSPDIEFDHWDEVFQKTVQKWVLDLQNAGVDLAEYGCREALAVEQTRGALDADAIVKSRTLIRHVMKEGPRTSRPGPEDMRRWNETHWVPIRLLGLNVGPQPKDWRLMWAPEFEWMAQQFWTLVEKGDTVMPGSWVES
ncbi:hypothetical protein QQZ08_004205 [Neonectria magnoliae]|uniref:Uncharacterized protein n=1 Tax=Neonectria magnoliae TaxID=2732573 RepID=A0ABR1I6M4_9HYPO